MTNKWHETKYQPLALLKGPCALREYELVSTRGADNTGCGISLRVLVVGMVDGREAAARAHLYADQILKPKLHIGEPIKNEPLFDQGND